MTLWKRGVLQRGKFAQHALSQEKQHKGWWLYSYNILRELELDYHPVDEPLLERVYKSLAAGASIYKITRRERFTDFDSQLIAAACDKFQGTSELVIHDIGASNAITSLELYRRFQKARGTTLMASDYFTHLVLVDSPSKRWPSPHWTIAFDHLNTPIQVTGMGSVFGRKLYTWRYAFSRLLQLWINRNVIPAAQALLEQGQPEFTTKVSLFHPEAIEAARHDKQFRLIHHDIFTPNPIPCQIVRAMNVLTPKHFTHEQTAKAIHACTVNLSEGGWLILGRSIDEEDGRLRASVYQWTEGHLEPAWHYNEGYEWPDLVTQACE